MTELLHKMLFAVGCFALIFTLNIHAVALSPDDISSAAAVLIDADTGQVLFEKNKGEVMYPASVTKVMTGLLVAELCQPEDMIQVSKTAIDISEPGSTNMGLVAGELLSVDSAMYGMMLLSANDAANVLAEHTAGSLQIFTNMMNQKARLLGAENTHFANAHGLHEKEHFTTAYDIALITQKAIKNEQFMKYFSSVSHEIPPTNLFLGGRNFTNGQYMLNKDSQAFDPTVIGGKVGYTHEALNTMTTAAFKDGRILIAVVLKCPDRDQKFRDTKQLLDYGFNEFTRHTVSKDEVSGLSVPLTDGNVAIGAVDFVAGQDISLLLHQSVNPKDVMISYDVKESYNKDELMAATAKVFIPTNQINLPTTLATAQLESNITLGSKAFSPPKVKNAKLEDKNKKSFSMGAEGYAILLFSSVLVIVVVCVLIRQRYVITLKQKHKR